MELKIIQLNIRHYDNLRHILYDYIERERPDILLLNSTCVINGRKIKHPGYTSRQTADGEHRGVSILVNSTFRHEFLTDNYLHHSFMAVKLFTNKGPIIVATAYVNPRMNLPFHDFNQLFNRSNLPIFFAGDLNAAHTDFFHNDNNRHGCQLSGLFKAHNLHYLGPDFHTFFGGAGNKGRPDLVFANRMALPYHSHCSPGPMIGSDHVPVIIRISTSPIRAPTHSHFCYKRANWEDFAQDLLDANLQDRCNVNGIATRTLDDHWQLVLDTIKAAMERNIPKVTYKVRSSFRPSIRTQRLLVCYQNRFSQNTHRIRQVMWDLTVLRNHLITSYARDRAEYWADLVRKTEQDRVTSPWEFWQSIRKLKGTSSEPFHYLEHGGQNITDPEQVVKIFKDHWEGVFRPHPVHPAAVDHVNSIDDWIRDHAQDITHLPYVDLERLSNDSELTSPIYPAEVKDIIKGLKRKAPGSSQIGRDVMRHIPDPVLTVVTNLYNAMLATGYFPAPLKVAILILIAKPGKPNTLPANFRPISLLELLAKIFETILNRRLRDHLEDKELLSKKQFGFRPHRSTQDALNVMLTYIKNGESRRLKTYMVTKDVEKAFDTVWHNGLKYKICNNFELPPLTCRILCSFLDDRQCRIRFRGILSDPFTPRAGEPQGSVLSPTMYIMYTTDLPDPRQEGSLTIQYADDCTHFTRSLQIAFAARYMNDELNRVSYWEWDWRIKTNPTKSKVICLQPRCSEDRVDPIYINKYEPRWDTRLKLEKSVTVLGLTLDKRLLFHSNATKQRSKARVALGQLYRFRDASAATKRHLYQAMVKPHLTYCPLALSLSALGHRKDLQIVQNDALRWVHNIRRLDFANNSDIHEATKNTPALNILWAKHTHRQFNRLRMWCPEWVEELTRHAVDGYYRRLRSATNYLETDFSIEVEPMY